MAMAMSTQQMNVEVMRPVVGQTTRVRVTGELDLSTINQLRDELTALLAQQPGPVEVDLSAVTFFSCAAAQMLWSTHRHATNPLTIVGAARAVKRLLHIMELLPLLTPTASAGRTGPVYSSSTT